MESNITDQQHLPADLQLSEPHFDEEATLLSARRVVPLRNIGVKPPSHKRLVYGMTIIAAVMAGAFGATLLYKQRGQKQASAIETAASVSEPARAELQPLSGTGGAIVDSQAPASSLEPAPPLSQTAKSVMANETRQNEDRRRRNAKEVLRAERIEARLRRSGERESRREARGHNAPSSRDLLRIREIFEGSPRP